MATNNATITNSLIVGLTNQMVQARLDTADAKPFKFATYFPLRRINGFKWVLLQNQVAPRNVAADLHSDNATTMRKERAKFQLAMGDVPLISISREMKRSEIKDYQTALALAKDEDATKLVQYWGEDVDFCFNGVQSELEYIAWALLSGGGKLSFTPTNNATYANEFDLDYQVDAEAKVKTGSNWGEKNNADIIGDLVAIIKGAKARGLNPKFAFVSLEEFYKICSAEQIIKACASFASNALGIAQTPDLEQVNNMLARQAWLNGLQLRVIDQDITRAYLDGSYDTANPFEAGKMVLSESERLGTTQYDILQDNGEMILRAERSHTVIKKYGTIEPQGEVTIGQADALPVLDSAYRNVYVKTDAQEWD